MYICSTTYIMWKESFVIFCVIFLFQTFITAHIFKSYKRIFNAYSEDMEQGALKENVEKIMRRMKIFFLRPWGKKIYFMYNNLCFLLASVALLENNDEEFIYHMNKIEKENDFEMKAFALALYYRSKNQNDVAQIWYEKYLNAVHYDAYFEIVLKAIFESKGKDNDFYNVIREFKNPAIQKLFIDNGIDESMMNKD